MSKLELMILTNASILMIAELSLKRT